MLRLFFLYFEEMENKIMINAVATTKSTVRQAARSAPGHKSVVHPGSQTSPLPNIFIQRKSSCACGGGCPRCQAGGIDQAKTKLRINDAGDKYEQEADQVAKQVTRMPEPQAQRKAHPSSQNEDEVIQTKSVDNAGHTQTVDKSPLQSMQSSSGQPLDSATRSFMEPRFGHDFGQVRLHTGRQAAESAQAINARAYTVGRDVVFGEGQYAPRTDTGRELLAHELTHVLQQRHNPMIQCRKKNTAPAALPNGTTAHRGSLQSARWLQGHRNSGNPFSEFVTYLFVGSSLSSQTTQNITATCNQRGGVQDRLLCLHDEVHASVLTLEGSDGNLNDNDYVCRNYASSLHDVSQQMGLSPDWETSTTHAWVEFTYNNRQYVIDAYNQIMFSYPR
jgi:hypothetical protein